MCHPVGTKFGVKKHEFKFQKGYFWFNEGKELLGWLQPTLPCGIPLIIQFEDLTSPVDTKRRQTHTDNLPLACHNRVIKPLKWPGSLIIVCYIILTSLPVSWLRWGRSSWRAPPCNSHQSSLASSLTHARARDISPGGMKRFLLVKICCNFSGTD